MAASPQIRKYASPGDPSPGAARSLRVARALASWLDEARAIPVLGDLFDFGWKANTRNVALLETWVARPGPTRRASSALVAALVAAVIAVAAAVGFATWRLVAWAAGR